MGRADVGGAHPLTAIGLGGDPRTERVGGRIGVRLPGFHRPSSSDCLKRSIPALIRARAARYWA
jgi:hypothetical protein